MPPLTQEVKDQTFVECAKFLDTARHGDTDLGFIQRKESVRDYAPAYLSSGQDFLIEQVARRQSPGRKDYTPEQAEYDQEKLAALGFVIEYLSEQAARAQLAAECEARELVEQDQEKVFRKKAIKGVLVGGFTLLLASNYIFPMLKSEPSVASVNFGQKAQAEKEINKVRYIQNNGIRRTAQTDDIQQELSNVMRELTVNKVSEYAQVCDASNYKTYEASLLKNWAEAKNNLPYFMSKPGDLNVKYEGETEPRKIEKDLYLSLCTYPYSEDLRKDFGGVGDNTVKYYKLKGESLVKSESGGGVVSSKPNKTPKELAYEAGDRLDREQLEVVVKVDGNGGISFLDRNTKAPVKFTPVRTEVKSKNQPGSQNRI